MHCRELVELTIPDAVKEAEQLVFSYCKNLQKVHIPASVKKMAPNAFFWSQKVTIYAPEGSYAQKYAAERGIPFVAE